MANFEHTKNKGCFRDSPFLVNFGETKIIEFFMNLRTTVKPVFLACGLKLENLRFDPSNQIRVVFRTLVNK